MPLPRHLRIRPFDTGTEDGRADERLRLAMWSVVANAASKAASMVLVLAGVHLTIGYLGAERFGIWMTVLSFASILSFLDLGVGNALTNAVARRAAGSDPASLRSVVGGGLAVLALLGTGFAALLWLLLDLVPWQRVIRSDSATLAAEARQAGAVFAVCFGLTVLSGGVQKVFLGLQRSFEAHLATGLVTLATIGAIAFAARHRADVPTLLAITMAGQALAALPLLWLLARRGLLQARGLLASVRAEGPGVMRSGGMFLALQIGTMVGWGADMLIVSMTLGAAQVAAYAVVQRLFQFATMPLAILNQPLWGAYADAHARRDHGFIRRTLARSLAITGAAALMIAAVLAALHEPIIATWAKGQVEVPMAFVLTYAAWAVIEAVAVCASMYMNGCAIVAPQLVAVMVFCALSIPLKLVCATEFGLTGLVGATIAAYLVAVPLLYATLFRREVSEPARLG